MFRSILQQHHPKAFFHGDRTRREIALTFDDGPHPRDTPQVLGALARLDICATFFLIGQSAERYPQLVRQIHQSGHQPALHCYRHLPFPMESASTLKGGLDRSRTAIARACDLSPENIRHVRPPYGLFTAKILSLLSGWGYQLVLWDNMPLHFLQPARRTIAQILERTAPGSIIVLHDGKGHGRKVAEIVDVVVPQLKARGFMFVTIDQMQNSITGETK
jgi:peptidoglycan/xylan/chitin deacetylase (PgdA/CDA1 family)